jgi:uroporphyrinogen decarboxylase
MRFLDAARSLPTDRTPVWFMRQAGRYLPEYRQIRQKHAILEICRSPELAAQVTLQPLGRFPDLDAAIIFSDILLVLEAMGARIAFGAGEGPSIEADPAALHAYEPVAPLAEAIRLVKRATDKPLLGFAGAPFTLASYLVEGGASKDYLRTKALMLTPAWEPMMRRLAEAVAAHLRLQIDAGVDAVQLFDSWVGALSPEDYRRFVLPYTRSIFERVNGVPRIHFGTGTAGLLELMRQAGGEVIGLDWRVNLDEAWGRLGPVAVQGNLDPAAMLAPRARLLDAVDEILRRAAGRPGHIFNLGHGVLPETSPDQVAAVIDRVHAR